MVNWQKLVKWNGEPFPAPFQSKPIFNNSHISKYTTTTPATNRVSYSVVRFLLDMYEIQKGTLSAVAIGNNLSMNIAERLYVDDAGKQTYQISVFEVQTQKLFAFLVDPNTNAITSYGDNMSGKIYLFSLWEVLLNDEEFFNNYSNFVNYMNNDNIDDAWDCISVLSDNIYRRLKNDDSIEIVDKSVPEMTTAVTSGNYRPTNVIYGNFDFLGNPTDETNVITIPINDFVGKYPINPNREFTAYEKEIMDANRLEDFYIVMNDDVEICNDIVKTTNSPKPFRTFTLVGPPGTGKSHKCKAVANGIVLPHVIKVCNPSTEIFEFIGDIMPPSMDDMEREAWDLAFKLEQLGGINFKNIAKIYNLPTSEDVMYAPDIVYEDITGNKKTPTGKIPTVDDAIKAWTVYMTEQFNTALRQMTVAMKTGKEFRYTETDFIRAIKNGWCVEIQEPNVILNEGVLVGLNSILNEGVITLQDGKTVRRHPDSVVFFTTNYNLNGCRNMNQSFLDRSSEIFYVNTPPISVVADRVISVSGNTDRKMVVEMCKIGETVAKIMEKEGIDDGVCGMRSLINWAIKATYTNPYDAAIKTLVNKASLDDNNRKIIQKKLDESWFYQFKGR